MGEKARQAADEFGIQDAYDSYEALIADDSIDAVYIPLPNHLHREWTLRALRAGKHVLCEKPLALTAAEAEEMAAAAATAGVKLAEAFMYRHHPRYEMIRSVIASGEIGQIRGIHAHSRSTAPAARAAATSASVRNGAAAACTISAAIPLQPHACCLVRSRRL